jgi:hypothetical protein
MQLELVISYFSDTKTVEISSAFSTASKAEVPERYKDAYLEVNGERLPRKERKHFVPSGHVHIGYNFNAKLPGHPAELKFALGRAPGDVYRLTVPSNAFAIKGLPDKLVEPGSLVVTYEGPAIRGDEALSVWAGQRGDTAKPLDEILPDLAGRLEIPAEEIAGLPKGDLAFHFILLTRRSFPDDGMRIDVTNTYSAETLLTTKD